MFWEIPKYRTGIPGERRARKRNVNSVSSSQFKVQPNIENRTGALKGNTPGFEQRIYHLLAGWPWASCLIFYICIVSTSCCGNNWVNIYKVLRTVPGAKGVDNKYLLMLLHHYVGRFHLRASENKRMSSDITGFLDPAVPEALHLLYFPVPINFN